MVLPTVAGKEEVIERAIQNLKEKFGTEMTEKEMTELYDITAKYIKHKLNTEDFCAVQLNNLGKAYYPQTVCKEKARHQNMKRETRDRWKRRDQIIEEYFQDNQRNVNRKKYFRVYHVLTLMKSKNNRRGWDMYDIEESQNSED